MSEPNERSQTITLRVNGTERRGQVEPRKLLVDFLREDLGLTGSHVGCETRHLRGVYDSRQWRIRPLVSDAGGAGQRSGADDC